MTVDLYHRIGSVTKTFTGTLVMQLAAERRLNLDDAVSMYVPGVPNGDTITVRQLANMTSGLPSYTLDEGWQRAFFSNPQRVWSPDELLAISFALPVRFNPGEQFDYSNTNSILLGRIAENVTGEHFDEILTSRIIEPLGLAHTSFPGSSPALPDPHPQGFTLQGMQATPDEPSNATNWNPSWGWAAGEMISTAADLIRYGRAVVTGEGLLPPDAQLERLTSFPESGGYGMAIGCSDGWVGHTGELPGFNTSVFHDTRTDSTVVVTTNSDIPSGGCEDAATLADNPMELPCAAPAVRIFVGIAEALGHPYAPPS